MLSQEQPDICFPASTHLPSDLGKHSSQLCIALWRLWLVCQVYPPLQEGRLVYTTAYGGASPRVIPSTRLRVRTSAHPKSDSPVFQMFSAVGVILGANVQ